MTQFGELRELQTTWAELTAQLERPGSYDRIGIIKEGESVTYVDMFAERGEIKVTTVAVADFGRGRYMAAESADKKVGYKIAIDVDGDARMFFVDTMRRSEARQIHDAVVDVAKKKGSGEAFDEIENIAERLGMSVRELR